MKLNITIYFIFISVLSCSYAVAQQAVFYSNALVHVNDNALVHVNGNLIFTGNDAKLTNRGNVDARTSVNAADMSFRDTAHISGNGNYRLQGDWINSADFVCDSSHVYLDGANQLITGDSVTTFHKLELDSSGVKTQTLAAFVNKQLILNHLELATDIHKMYVVNPANNAVTNTQVFNQEGMVSSIGNGALHREMNTTVSYLFPLGSSLNTRRYRPLNLMLSATGANAFEARLVNHNPTIDGFDINAHDSVLCLVNKWYYHNIDQVIGTQSTTVEMKYLPQSDGLYNEMVQWNTPINNKWNNLNASVNTTTPFRSVTIPNWTNFSNTEFALGKFRPNGPLVQGSAVVCDSTMGYDYVVVGNAPNTTYAWSTSQNGTLNSGQGTVVANVSWAGSGGGSLSTVTLDTMGCVSYPTELNITLTHINAAFDTVLGPLFGQVVVNNISIGATEYQWQFGNEGESAEENSGYIFNDAGLHHIILTATNGYGCEDTASIWVEVIPGINIPNVFTPNGDGDNEFFRINAIGMVSQELFIFNRWGQELYYINDNDVEWDGTIITSGKPASEGTYFYLYKASSLTKEFEYSGALMLVR